MHTNLLRIHNLGLCNGNRMNNIVNSLEYVIKFINKREINLLIITGFMPDRLSHYVQKFLDDFFDSICSSLYLFFFVFFFYLGFLSRTFTIHETAGEGGGYLFISSLPLPPASRTLRH